MGSPENTKFDFVDDQLTVSDMLAGTINQLFKDYESSMVSTIYENRHISLLHLKNHNQPLDTNDYRVAYESVGARESDNKKGLIISGIDIEKEETEDISDRFYPRKNAIRHYYLEKISDNTETDGQGTNQEFLTPLGQLEKLIGELLVDNYAVRREHRYFGSITGKSPLLAGKIFDRSTYDEYEDNLQTFFEDMLETKNLQPEKASGYGSFHQIKNLTRNIVKPDR